MSVMEFLSDFPDAVAKARGGYSGGAVLPAAVLDVLA